MKSLISILITLFLLSAVTVEAGAPDTLWTRTYGGADKETTERGLALSDGSYAIGGYSMSFGYPDDAYIVKIDPDGDTLWTGLFGAGYFDYVCGMAEAADGQVVVAGKHSDGVGQIRKAWLFKTDDTGGLVWEENYIGVDDLETQAMIATADSGFLLCGYTPTAAASYDFWMLKTDSTGDSTWFTSFGGDGDDRPTALQQTDDGGYLLVGTSKSFSAGGDSDVWAVKTDAYGDTVWTRVFGNENNEGNPLICRLNDGNFMIVTSTVNPATAGYDPYLIILEPDGDTVRTQFRPCELGMTVLAVCATSDGGLILGGSASYGYPLGGEVYIVRLNAAMDTAWSMHTGGKGADKALYVHEEDDLETVILGHWYGSTSAAEFYAVKLDTWSSSCCHPPTVGDVNQDDIVDITDIQVMVDHQFLSLDPLICVDEGDINADAGVDITDLQIMIDYQFISLTDFPPCP